MSDEINTAESGADALASAEPKNDLQAAANEAATPAVTEEAISADDEAAKAEADKKAEEAKQAEEKKRNRTKEYISSLQKREAEAREQALQLQQRLEALERRISPHAKQDGPPRLEDYDYDLDRHQAALVEYAKEEALRSFREQQQQEATQRRLQEVVTSYVQRADEFAESHPDFDEVVASIPYQLHPAVQAAIQAHPSGPELAYHLGNDFDDAFQLASIQPHLAAAAVERLAARLSAAPAAEPAAPAPPPPTPAPKPITQAPPPPPTVGGRSPAETPPEKLTDDQWYARERERQRKR